MTSAKTLEPAYPCGGTVESSQKKHLRTGLELNLPLETIVRILLTCIYIGLEFKAPFVRKIQPEELWLYRNPRSDSYVPLTMLWPVVLGVPGLFFTLHYLRTRDRQDLRSAVLAFTLGLGLNGVVTNTIKIAVGRPRPDFFWRCFPDGVMNDELRCTGTDMRALMDGRKSFPSGHSSFAFAGLGFLTWYLIGKLHLMNERGRGRSVRLILAGLPLFAATMIAISRTCDYHHHWQDVTVGSLIGIVLSYVCYRQYYPAFAERNCHLPYLHQQLQQELLCGATTLHHSPNRGKRLQAGGLPSSGSSPAVAKSNYEGNGADDSEGETRSLLSPTADQKEAKWI
uniref:Phosphatidic acid phosphatase type 2/haloperoxidase domain-containing protein n=1 Tax=Anopheles atroparvus TaxID=41427 RepID=A0A182JKV8_ANOAO